MKLKYLWTAIYSVVIVFLLASVIKSGYFYQFDPDELYHINFVYLFQHGAVPYRDVFFIFLPLYHWLLTPLSSITGFTFQLLTAARLAMIGLFLIRLVLLYALVRKLFGNRIALIFVPLYLFDPFTVFTGMQVRPDNLMMTLYTASLLLIVHWQYNKKSALLPWAGLFMGLSVATLVKIGPAAAVLSLFIVVELVKTRQFRHLFLFLGSLGLPFLYIFVWAVSKGIFPLMLQQIIIDGKQLNDILRYPQNILNYYWPPNTALFGFDGRPIPWVYELCLPLFAFAGMHTTGINTQTYGNRKKFVGWLLASCLIQWVSLLFVRSVFIQYFLPVSWFLALFAAICINTILEKIQKTVIGKQIALWGSLVFLLAGLIVSWKANTVRASMNFNPLKTYVENQWNLIPPTATVFPGVLFRQSVYPVTYGSNIADFSADILKRYGSPSVYLVRYRVPFIVMDDYNFSFLDSQTKTYIQDNYERESVSSNMWILKS